MGDGGDVGRRSQEVILLKYTPSLLALLLGNDILECNLLIYAGTLYKHEKASSLRSYNKNDL